MPIKTKRWNDPPEPDDGHRLLVCRYRPRALRKTDETWDAWDKSEPPISFKEFATRYRKEMLAQAERIAALAERVAAGETITLLCSAACTDVTKCHRTLLKKLIEDAVCKRNERETAER